MRRLHKGESYSFTVERTNAFTQYHVHYKNAILTLKMSIVKYYTIVYTCHLCNSTNFSNARNLRDHYENLEGITYPSTRSRIYNTKSKKYISAAIAKSRKTLVVQAVHLISKL